MAGAKMTDYYPLSIVVHGVALNITVQSHVDKICFGLIACRRAVPDVRELGQQVERAMSLLRKLTAPAALAAPAKAVAAAAADPAPAAAASATGPASAEGATRAKRVRAAPRKTRLRVVPAAPATAAAPAAKRKPRSGAAR